MRTKTSLGAALILVSLSVPAFAESLRGSLDLITIDGVAKGWCSDGSDPTAGAVLPISSLTVAFYADGPTGRGTPMGRAYACAPTSSSVRGAAGFEFAIPNAWRDAKRHTLYAYAIDSSGGRVLLESTPRTFEIAPGPSGTMTLHGRELVIGTSSTFGGAVTELTWNREQIVNSSDHGREIQMACSLNHLGGAYNPTEAGSAADGFHPTSSSVLVAASSSYPFLRTIVHPAFWNNGEGAVNLCPVAAETFTKEIQVDFLGDPHLIRWETGIRLFFGCDLGCETPTPYVSGGPGPTDFNHEMFNFEPATGTLTPLSHKPIVLGERRPPPLTPLPVILAASHTLAIGVWSPERDVTYGRWDFSTLLDPTAKTDVIHHRTVNAGTEWFQSYLAVGTLDQVRDSLTRAYRAQQSPFASALTFDERYYLGSYPDVAAAVAAGKVLSGFSHYMDEGQHEGRNPNASFDEKAYLAANPEVAAAVAQGQMPSGFWHWKVHGFAEGRDPAPRAAPVAPRASTVSATVRSLALSFDEDFYLAENPEVKNALAKGLFSSGRQQFLAEGQRNGRNPNAYLHEGFYCATYPEVAAMVAAGQFPSGWAHYCATGFGEGREPASPALAFNPDDYLTTYPDAAAAVHSGQCASALDHYIRFGAEERRNPNATFDESYYLGLYDTVAADVKKGDDLSGWVHYRLHGWSEDRRTHP